MMTLIINILYCLTVSSILNCNTQFTVIYFSFWLRHYDAISFFREYDDVTKANTHHVLSVFQTMNGLKPCVLIKKFRKVIISPVSRIINPLFLS